MMSFAWWLRARMNSLPKNTRLKSGGCSTNGAVACGQARRLQMSSLRFFDPSIEANSLVSPQEKTLRSKYGLDISRRQFGGTMAPDRERLLREIKTYFAKWPRLETAECEIVRAEEIAGALLRLRVDIRYDFVATPTDGGREERVGLWRTEWLRDESNAWRAVQWEATEETVSRARDPIFIDITSHVLGQTESYKNQLAHGADYWRTVLDGACGLDVYGNNGLAVGDYRQRRARRSVRVPASWPS